MEPSEELKQEIFRRYNQNPVGWRVLVARDIEGHIDTVFIRGEDAWFLKEEYTSPYERLGVGERIVVKDFSEKMEYDSFGFRPIPQDTLKHLGETQNIDPLINQVLKTKPLPISSIKSPAFLEGPIIVSRSPQSELFETQKKLDLKLRVELNKLLERKYPHLRRMYG